VNSRISVKDIDHADPRAGRKQRRLERAVALMPRLSRELFAGQLQRVKDDEAEAMIGAAEDRPREPVEVLAGLTASATRQGNELAVDDAVIGQQLDELVHQAADARRQLGAMTRPTAPTATLDAGHQAIAIPLGLKRPIAAGRPLGGSGQQHWCQRAHTADDDVWLEHAFVLAVRCVVEHYDPTATRGL
jgi:hypothetical protein